MKIIAHACPIIITIIINNNNNNLILKKINNYYYVYAKYYDKNIWLLLYMFYIHQLLKS
jgi:hypothetical protein